MNIKTIEKDSNEYIKKYVIHNISLFIIANNIHPKWLIDEKAINFRIEVWFNPPKDPINIDKIIEIIKKL